MQLNLTLFATYTKTLCYIANVSHNFLLCSSTFFTIQCIVLLLSLAVLFRDRSAGWWGWRGQTNFIDGAHSVMHRKFKIYFAVAYVLSFQTFFLACLYVEKIREYLNANQIKIHSSIEKN